MSGPQRIVSLISSATEMLFGLGLGERVVGVSHECDWPAEAAAIERLTLSQVDSQLPSDAIDQQVRDTLRSGTALYQAAGRTGAGTARDAGAVRCLCGQLR
jgi:iron complex transport system substrate-binding protein